VRGPSLDRFREPADRLSAQRPILLLGGFKYLAKGENEADVPEPPLPVGTIVEEIEQARYNMQ
jgi:hypothetical protein